MLTLSRHLHPILKKCLVCYYINLYLMEQTAAVVAFNIVFQL